MTRRRTSSAADPGQLARQRGIAREVVPLTNGVAVLAAGGFVLAVGQEGRTGSFALLASCLVLVTVTGALCRWAAPGPSLAWLGVGIAAVAAWLVSQRPDPGSALILAVMFGVGTGLAAPPIVLTKWRHPVSSGAVAALGLLLLVLALVEWVGLLTSSALAGARPAILAATVGLVAVAAVIRRDRRREANLACSSGRLAVVAAVVIAGCGPYVAYLGASTPEAEWFGGGVRHGDRHGGEVAITFDDGPNVRTTPAVAAILDSRHVKGTFFIVGKALDATPDVARALYTDDHLVANHSYEHDQWRWLDPRYPELMRTQRAFRRDVGVCPAFFRPPHGQRTPFMRSVVGAHGVRLVMWDVSAGDWTTTNARLVAQRVLRKVRPGSIIDLHDGLDGNVDADRSVVTRALPLILDGLRARHLRPVRLDQLIGGPAYRPCAVEQH